MDIYRAAINPIHYRAVLFINKLIRYQKESTSPVMLLQYAPSHDDLKSDSSDTPSDQL
jgi:hypothetical protein